jgi:hypothetical protein
MYTGDVSTELTYALEHAVPPLMPPEPFRYLALRSLIHRWQRRER